MKKWPFLFLTSFFLALTTSFAAKATAVDNRSAKNVRPFAMSDSFPVPLITTLHHYTVANTHSHNDYEQPTPFWTAYNAQFGSIEADVFLVNGTLLVAHDEKELRRGKRTLEDYYLKPLAGEIAKHPGHPYADTSRQLQMLIDVKADSTAVLAALVTLLEKYPALSQTPSLIWVISGNRPPQSMYTSYPSFIAFDGVPATHYSPEALSRIVMMSDDLHSYTHWNGLDTIPATDRKAIRAVIALSHDLHLPIRFWDAPDFPNAWDQLMQLRVDFINTDHIRQLEAYLQAHP
jgi:alkaline phosphatase